MAITPSNHIPLGTKVPKFNLPDAISGKSISLDEIQSDSATVIMFICNHCPFVKHIQTKIVDLAKEYQQKGVAFIAINSNDTISYPEDNPDEMRKVAIDQGYTFPFLVDETQAIAKAYQAACTPEFYIINKDQKLIYHGRFDDATPGNNNPVTGKDLSSALDAVLLNKPLDSQQFPSVGCNIKWKKS